MGGRESVKFLSGCFLMGLLLHPSHQVEMLKHGFSSQHHAVASVRQPHAWLQCLGHVGHNYFETPSSCIWGKAHSSCSTWQSGRKAGGGLPKGKSKPVFFSFQLVLWQLQMGQGRAWERGNCLILTTTKTTAVWSSGRAFKRWVRAYLLPKLQLKRGWERKPAGAELHPVPVFGLSLNLYQNMGEEGVSSWPPPCMCRLCLQSWSSTFKKPLKTWPWW